MDYSFRRTTRLSLASGAFGVLTLLVACGGGSGSGSPAGPSSDPGFFENAGARLSYVVDRPAGSGPFPGIVLAHEGGQVTKAAYSPLAAELAQRGFMVLRYDKRGSGASTGTFEEVGTSNSERVVALLASDLVAAVQTLRQQNGVNAARVGLLGASQAGWVMPLAASQSADIKFMAAIVGPTVPVNVLYDYASNAENGLATFDQLSQAIAAYSGPRGFDPLPALRSLAIPAIWLMATQDRVVPTRESAAIVNDLVATSSKAFRVLQYPGGHEVRASTTFYGDLFAWLETVR